MIIHGYSGAHKDSKWTKELDKYYQYLIEENYNRNEIWEDKELAAPFKQATISRMSFMRRPEIAYKDMKIKYMQAELRRLNKLAVHSLERNAKTADKAEVQVRAAEILNKETSRRLSRGGNEVDKQFHNTDVNTITGGVNVQITSDFD